MPETRGNALEVTCFVDSNQVDVVACKSSGTEVMIANGMVPILRHNEKQGSMKTTS